MKEVNKAVLLSTCSPTLKITIAEVSKKVIKANNRWSFSFENNYLSLFKKKKSPTYNRTTANTPTKLKKKLQCNTLFIMAVYLFLKILDI